MAMTAHLEEALKDIKKIVEPNQVFTPYEVSGIPHNRINWICERLKEEGKLEDKSELVLTSRLPKVIYKYKIKQ